MTNPLPVRLAMEYADGSRDEVPFATLPEPLQDELLRQGFVRQAADGGTGGAKYVLLEWDDGWREVVEVDPSCTGLKRYYVIVRPEEVGRLSLSKEDGYPELLEVSRRPGTLVRITFDGTYVLEPGRTEREGTKVERHYILSPGSEGSLTALREALQRALAERGVDPRAVLQATDPDAGTALAEVGSVLGLSPARCRRDADGFLRSLLRTGGVA